MKLWLFVHFFSSTGGDDNLKYTFCFFLSSNTCQSMEVSRFSVLLSSLLTSMVSVVSIGGKHNMMVCLHADSYFCVQKCWWLPQQIGNWVCLVHTGSIHSLWEDIFACSEIIWDRGSQERWTADSDQWQSLWLHHLQRIWYQGRHKAAVCFLKMQWNMSCSQVFLFWFPQISAAIWC